MWFLSDNAAPAAPAVIDAVAAANAGPAVPYGDDPLSAAVAAALRGLFDAPDAAVHLVPTGTSGNALALACLCPPWATVFCHPKAHVAVDECGAVGFFADGATLTAVEGPDARLDPEALAAAIAGSGLSVHNVQRGAVAITNLSERGAASDPDAVARLAAVAHGAGLPLYMDGARFANAVAALGCTPAELSWRAGVDALTFGATKNGCLGAEAVILFDPAKAAEFALRRKRAGHLFSKHRYLAAQFAGYLADGLWLDLAGRANAAAARLVAGLAAIPGTRLLHPADGNMVFARLPAAAHARAVTAGARYYADPVPGEAAVDARLVCHWATGGDEVAALLAALAGPSEPARA